MKIYVASSWRNAQQPGFVDYLRSVDRSWEVYDFRHPAPGDEGFGWSQVREGGVSTPAELLEALEHPAAVRGFSHDMRALAGCDACVLLQPCGASAHLELGFCVGERKPTCVLLDQERFEPELMYNMVNKVALTRAEVVEWLRDVQRTREVMGRRP